MTKAKKNINYDSVASTPSETEEVSEVRCPHVGKAVSIPALKKALKNSWTKIGHCSPCVKERRTSSLDAKNSVNKNNNTLGAKNKDSSVVTIAKPVDPSKPITFWMCLRCGLQLCDSNSSSNHFNKHMEVPRSDLHCLALNLMSWKLFCHYCKNEVHVDSYKKTREAVDFIKRIEETKGRSGAGVSKDKSTLIKSPSITSNVSTSSSLSDANTSVILKARGLANLGNTCFFNAVMQSLNQTHPLTHLLDQHCQKGVPFLIPSVKVQHGSTLVNETLEPMSLQLSEASPMTLALASFVKEMNSLGKQGVFNPGHLFGQVCRKSPQFRGYQQQDAHELLRHLMEGLRTEEIKRQKLAILKYFDLSEKTDPNSVPTTTRQKLQALARYSNYTLVDKLFGGHLVSTIVCEQCHNSSQIYEPFLDLSLPLIEEKPHRPNNKKNKNVAPTLEDDVDAESEVGCFGSSSKGSKGQTASLSKHQLKKAKTKIRQNKRRSKKRQRGEKADEELIEEEEGEAAIGESEPAIVNGHGDETLPASDEGKSEMPEEDSKPAETDENLDGEENMKDKVEQKSEEENADQVQAGPKSKPALANNNTKPTDGNEEDDEDDGFSEDNEDWEWDYGEEWQEKSDENAKETEDDNRSEYLEISPSQPSEIKAPEEKVPLKSLNPLPREVYERGKSSEREKSSEPLAEVDLDAETGASSNGDVEDNIMDDSATTPKHNNSNPSEDINTDPGKLHLTPFHPDPDHLDPHMEQLCRKVRKMSVASVNVQFEDTNVFEDKENSQDQQQQFYLASDNESESSMESSRKLRLQNDWIARSLTSIAPRYHSQAGECSVYSCLTQFTAPELLTGNNKWACSKCSKIEASKQKLQNGEHSEDLKPEEKKPEKEVTVYSNASKQLLIYSPPAILTIHLKRFQQTIYNLKKVNRHVSFPLTLDLAPFCSSTSISTPSVNADAKELLYELYAIVEHSGRLQGGHYTAFVKSRSSTKPNYSDFFSSPTAKNEDIDSLISEIERKFQELKNVACDENDKDSLTNHINDENGKKPAPFKWYYISDSHVSETNEEKVLKSQAYLLFYDRVK